MEKDKLVQSLKELKQSSQKRNFKQSVDLIITLKNFDIKKTPVDFFMDLHYSRGRKMSVCALVGAELEQEAKNCDEYIIVDNFSKYAKEKKLIRQLANRHDFFIAQANLMAPVASTFGRVLGTRGKMPNPKAGCVVPPKTALKPLCERLQKLMRVNTKGLMFIQCPVGSEDAPEEQTVDNIMTVYNQVVHHLPSETQNIKSVKLKLTMGKPIKIDDKGDIINQEEELDKKKKGKN